jgi:hypothetical protein
VLTPVAREHGAAVLVIDHDTKNGEASRFARGSGAKLAACDVTYKVSIIQAFDRTTNGVLRMQVSRRPGLPLTCRPAEHGTVGGVRSSVVDVTHPPLCKVTEPARRLTLSARAGEDVARYWSRALGGAFSPVKQRGPH